VSRAGTDGLNVNPWCHAADKSSGKNGKEVKRKRGVMSRPGLSHERFTEPEDILDEAITS